MSEHTDGAPSGGALSGRRIALPETRELDRLARMLEAEGAETLRCPLVAILDAPDPAPIGEWLQRLPFDDLILFTGEGLRRLHGVARRLDLEAGFLEGLRRSRKITRGPKPERALRELGLKSDLRAEEPTTDGLIATLSACELRGAELQRRGVTATIAPEHSFFMKPLVSAIVAALSG
jgi:uroporphyrinogen-III synthase